MKEKRVRNIGVTSEASRGMTLNPSDTSNEPETTNLIVIILIFIDIYYE